jgi:hypothetical protein
MHADLYISNCTSSVHVYIITCSVLASLESYTSFQPLASDVSALPVKLIAL